MFAHSSAAWAHTKIWSRHVVSKVVPLRHFAPLSSLLAVRTCILVGWSCIALRSKVRGVGLSCGFTGFITFRQLHITMEENQFQSRHHLQMGRLIFPPECRRPATQHPAAEAATLQQSCLDPTVSFRAQRHGTAVNNTWQDESTCKM